MKEGILQFNTKETQGEGPECPQPRWQTPTQAAETREESDYFYALLFMPAINEQALSLSFEIREMP